MTAPRSGLQVEVLALPDAKVITPGIVRDERGFFSETFNVERFLELGLNQAFVQDNHSLSVPKGVVRGLHFQIPPRAQDKLIRVLRGAIFDVIVDIRVGSPAFGRHAAVVLSADNWQQLWVPKGFAHGFCTLEPNTEVLYKVTDFYAPDHDRGVRWNDEQLAINWPVEASTATLSQKDGALPSFGDLPTYFQY